MDISVGHLARRQIVGTARLKESTAQGNVIVLAPLLHTHLVIQLGGKIAEGVTRQIALVVSHHAVCHGDLVGVFFQESIHHGIVGKTCVLGGLHKFRLVYLEAIIDVIDGDLGMCDPLVVAAALQMVNAVAIVHHVALMGVRLKHQIHIALGERHAVIGRDLIARHLSHSRLVGSKAAVKRIHDKIGALLPQRLGFSPHQLVQLVPYLKIHVLYLVGSDGGIAIANGTDDAHANSSALHHHRCRGVVDTLIRFAVIDIDRQKRKLGKIAIFFDVLLAPVKLVIAKGHGGKIQLVHPIGNDQSFCEIGFGTSLPHVSRGKKDRVIVALFRVIEICGQLVHTGLAVGIVKLSVQVVDGVKIHHDHHRDPAAIAEIVGVGVQMRGAGGCPVSRQLCTLAGGKHGGQRKNERQKTDNPSFDLHKKLSLSNMIR